MASDLDDKAKRVRSLLSSYYGTDAAEQGSKGGGNGAPSYVGIDSKGFDPDRYVASLVSHTEIPIDVELCCSTYSSFADECGTLQVS
jgi:hypothetical protein